MPYGVLTDIFCIILGGIIGPNLNIKITYKYREPLIKIFGISALAIGIVSFIKVNCLPCVILALILGFILAYGLGITKFVILYPVILLTSLSLNV